MSAKNYKQFLNCLFFNRIYMKGIFKKNKETDVEISSMNELPENALVWAGLLKEE